MEKYFLYDDHLGIEIPHLQEDWEDIPEKMQHAILLKWEQVRGKIPDRIKELEHYINAKQHHLNNEEDFEISCKLNSEIADLASIINDLWLWYRLTQNVSEGTHNKKACPSIILGHAFCRNTIYNISLGLFSLNIHQTGQLIYFSLSVTLQKQLALLHIQSFSDI